MAKTHGLSVGVRAFLKAYPWRTIDPVPVSVLRKPLSQCRLALISSAGLVVRGDIPFDSSVRGGDFSYRVIPRNADLQSLEEHHISDSFDHSGIGADRNLALPLDRARELAGAGVIAEVAPNHISLMGSITAPGRLTRRTAPQISKLLLADQVDIALLVPV